MTGQDLYEKAVVFGALPATSGDWYALGVFTRDAWDELAAQVKNTWLCSRCYDEIDPESVPELVKE